jgi:YidC/Oxa1 family membrane protein insertase
MDNQRFLLFAALALIVMMLWSAWESEHPQAPAPTTVAGTPTVPAAPTAPTAPPAPKTSQLTQGQRIKIATDLLQAEIDTQGGDIRLLELTKYPIALGEPDKPFRLLTDQGDDLFVAQTGLIGRDVALSNHKTLYTAENKNYQLAPNQDRLEIPLTWVGSDGLRVRKIFTFHRNDYRVDVAYEVTNGGKKSQDIFLYAQWLRHHVDKGSSFTSLPTYTGGVVHTPEKAYQKVDFAGMVKKPLALDTDGGWVAIIQHYFVGAWLPGDKEHHQFYSDTAPDNHYLIGYKTLTPTTVAPGAKATLATSMYAGPKEQHRLEKAAPGLKLTVDYGWLDLIASPLFWILEWLHKLVGNWGWAIILLTILIKAVFYPLSVASYRSMAQMRKMQPRLQALKERFGDDKQKLHQAMMELYKTEKINPLGGCLPILVQIPVFLALYWVLLESIELRQAPWALWIKDLSAPDPFFVLPIIMGASMLAQQWLNPQPLDDLQKKMMYAMPVVFTFMFLFFPSGLVLYWVVQNVLSIAQQWQINRAIEGSRK